MDKDVAAIGIDARLVEIGGQPIVVLRNEVVHILAATFVVNGGGVDDLVVVLAVVIASIDRGSHIDIRDGGAGIGFHAKGREHM